MYLCLWWRWHATHSWHNLMWAVILYYTSHLILGMWLAPWCPEHCVPLFTQDSPPSSQISPAEGLVTRQRAASLKVFVLRLPSLQAKVVGAHSFLLLADLCPFFAEAGCRWGADATTGPFHQPHRHDAGHHGPESVLLQRQADDGDGPGPACTLRRLYCPDDGGDNNAWAKEKWGGGGGGSHSRTEFLGSLTPRAETTGPRRGVLYLGFTGVIDETGLMDWFKWVITTSWLSTGSDH